MKLFLSSALLLLFASPCLAVVAITTKSLPNGTVDTAFSAAVNAYDGCTPYKWALVSGSLPSGISDVVSTNTESLDLRGTPTKAGTYSFTVAVTGCGGHVSEVSYKIVVQAAANHVVDLSWNASTSSNISGYNVYRSPNGNTWTKINPSLIASTIYSDDTVADGSTYYYSATAVNVEGIESSKSATVKTTVP
jgi:hypothetical protein